MWPVLAPIVRWPLYSRGRLFGVLSVLVVTLFVVGQLHGSQETGAPAVASPTTTGPTATASPSSAPPTSTPTQAASADLSPVDTAAAAGDEEGPLGDVDPSMLAGEAASGFVALWARPDLSGEAWLAQLSPAITSRLVGELEGVDPATVPAVVVTAQPIEVDYSATAAVYDVPTSGQWVRVHLVMQEGSWLTDAVEPV